MTGRSVNERTTGTMSWKPVPRVEQHGTLGTQDQIAVVPLIIARLTDRIRRRIQRLHDEVIVNPSSGERRQRLGQHHGNSPVQVEHVLGAQVRRQKCSDYGHEPCCGE